MNKANSTTPDARFAALLGFCCLIGCSIKEPETPAAEKTPDASQATDRDNEPPASEPAEELAAPPDESPGLAVGEPAPPFELEDQDGELRSLAEILKAGPAALVFYRSADWWPHCRRQLVQLRDNFERIESTGAQLVGISYDSVDTLHSFSQTERIPFLLLSDADSETIHAYGLHFQDGLPHPGTVLVDRNGVIRRKLFKDGYIKRHDIDELVSAIEAVK